MTGLAIIAAATVGLMGVDGEAPAMADSNRVVKVLGLDPDDVRPIALDAQLQPWWAVDVRIAPCAGMPGRDLDAAVKAADAQLADLESAAAMATLKDALEATPCAAGWVDGNAFKIALESWGHAAQEEGDESTARGAYGQLVAADPGWRIRPPPGSGFEELYDAVRADAAAAPRVPLSVHGGVREVRLNGAPVASPTARVEVGAGRHLVQWSDDGVTIQGAWIVIPGTSTSPVLVTSHRPDAIALLETGMDTDAGRGALRAWLGALAKAHGLAEIVVLVETGTPPAGYRLTDGLTRWTASAEEALKMQPDRVRLLVGGGWLTTDTVRFQHGDIRFAMDVKIVGPLHVHLDVSAGVARLGHSADPAWDGAVVWLPGVGGGLAIRRPTGLVQPFFAATAGFWSTPAFDVDGALGGIPLNEDESKISSPGGPVTVRVFGDGGVDVIPAGGKLRPPRDGRRGVRPRLPGARGPAHRG